MHLIKKTYKRINSRYYYSCIALFNLLLSIYGLCHLNYLDDPRITPFHVKNAFSLIAGMTDDLWFNLLLMLVSIALFIAIIANKHKWASAVFIISIFIIIMVCLAFSVRALEQHDNITWIVSLILILMAIHSPREDGGIK